MNIGGIGNTGVDYSRYSSRQVEQQAEQQEALEQQAEQAASVQKSAESQETSAKAQSNATAQSGASSVAGVASQLAEAPEANDDEDSDQALINKANAGSVLTKSELSRLKEADPALYSHVVKAEQAREELRNQMQQKPSAAKQAVQSAISQNNSEGQEIVRKALTDEYNNFASKYDQVELRGGVGL